jgi:hypothetical protein
MALIWWQIASGLWVLRQSAMLDWGALSGLAAA